MNKRITPKIGIAILSTDRPECTNRLLDSIEKYTDVTTLNLFVMDDSTFTNQKSVYQSCNRDWLTWFQNGERVGIARNTNSAIRVLESYDYTIIMNNDVEVLKKGWEKGYPNAMRVTGFHHFCFRQLGLWGACKDGESGRRPDKRSVVNKVGIATISKDPQGAIMAFDKKAFETVGYYDSKTFKKYGKSHPDWSHRVSISEIQPEGIHDLSNSNDYFVVHDTPSTTPDKERRESYIKNTEIFNRVLADRKKTGKVFIPYVYVSNMG